jgi:hypothetical protein
MQPCCHCGCSVAAAAATLRVVVAVVVSESRINLLAARGNRLTSLSHLEPAA